MIQFIITNIFPIIGAVAVTLCIAGFCGACMEIIDTDHGNDEI